MTRKEQYPELYRLELGDHETIAKLARNLLKDHGMTDSEIDAALEVKAKRWRKYDTNRWNQGGNWGRW